MKSIKFAGLCLVAVFAMSMVAAGTASAAPHWLACTSGAAGTKYTTGQCTTASSTGTWAWSEPSSTEASVTFATLTLKDNVFKVTVACTGEGRGSVGPGKFDRINEINHIACKAGTGCEKLEENAKPLHLPWQTELYETESKIRDKITAVNGEGAGWSVKCKAFGIVQTDECTSEEGSVGVTNASTPGVSGELLVLGEFDAKTAKANCTKGGAGSGEVTGPTSTLLVSGNGLRVSK